MVSGPPSPRTRVRGLHFEQVQGYSRDDTSRGEGLIRESAFARHSDRSAPGWVGRGKFWSRDATDYYAKWLRGLRQDPDLGEILRHAHSRGTPTALLCHGPVALAAAMPRCREYRAALAAGDTEGAKGLSRGWPYAGYRMTVFSDDEERYAEEHYLKGGNVPFYPGDVLKVAGGDVSISDKGIFQPFLVEDRELITGQNPPSDHLMAERLVEALDRATSKALMDEGSRTQPPAAFA